MFKFFSNNYLSHKAFEIAEKKNSPLRFVLSRKRYEFLYFVRRLERDIGCDPLLPKFELSDENINAGNLERTYLQFRHMIGVKSRDKFLSNPDAMFTLKQDIETISDDQYIGVGSLDIDSSFPPRPNDRIQSINVYQNIDLIDKERKAGLFQIGDLYEGNELLPSYVQINVNLDVKEAKDCSFRGIVINNFFANQGGVNLKTKISVESIENSQMQCLHIKRQGAYLIENLLTPLAVKVKKDISSRTFSLGKLKEQILLGRQANDDKIVHAITEIYINNPSALGAIVQLFENPAIYRTLGKNGKQKLFEFRLRKHQFELGQLLAQIPDTFAEEVEAVSYFAERLIKVAEKEDPNEVSVKTWANMLREGSKNIVNQSTNIKTIVSQIEYLALLNPTDRYIEIEGSYILPQNRTISENNELILSALVEHRVTELSGLNLFRSIISDSVIVNRPEYQGLKNTLVFLEKELEKAVPSNSRQLDEIASIVLFLVDENSLNPNAPETQILLDLLAQIVNNIKVNNQDDFESTTRNLIKAISDEINFGYINRLFAPTLQQVAQANPTAVTQVIDLKEEVGKGEWANDEKMADLISDIAEAVPTAVEGIVNLFTNSTVAEAAGGATKYILKRISK